MDSAACDSKHLVPTTIENKTEASQNEDADTKVIRKPGKGDKTQSFAHFNEQRYSERSGGSRLFKAESLGEDDYLRSDISYTDGDHRRDDPHQKCSQDQIFSRLFGAESETSANYAANEAVITDTAENTKDGAEFASLGENHQLQQQNLQRQQPCGVGDEGNSPDGELVCTLLVPEIVKVNNTEIVVDPHHDNISVCGILTPDSDRDSGCFSEELGVVKEAAETEEVRLSDVDTNLTENRDVCKLKRGAKCLQQLNFPRPSYTGGTGRPRPFQRKIWKRRNGWFRVRYPVTGQARATVRSHG